MLSVSDRMTENIIKEVMERDSKYDFDLKKGRRICLKLVIKKINSLGITFNVWEKKNEDGKGSNKNE